MKKQSKGIFVLLVLVMAMIAGGTFLFAEHLGAGAGTKMTTEHAISPDADVQQDVSTNDAVAATMQNFSGNGYSFSVPADWNIERMGTGTIALHSDGMASNGACKIEVSAFPPVGDADVADWIARRIGADPSLSVAERSSEEVSLSGGTGIKWIGTIDGVQTTLVYAFNDSHAYEIAPSIIGAAADGDPASCDDMLQTFLSAFAI